MLNVCNMRGLLQCIDMYQSVVSETGACRRKYINYITYLNIAIFPQIHNLKYETLGQLKTKPLRNIPQF